MEEGWDKCGRTGGLKGAKGQTYEGGIRVPGIVRWPGTVPAGVVSDRLVSSLVGAPCFVMVARAWGGERCFLFLCVCVCACAYVAL